MIMQPQRPNAPLPPEDAIATWLATARAWSPDASASWVTKLRREGVDLPSPSEVAPHDVPSVLARLIDALAEHEVFLVHTDHLDDASLYRYLILTALAAPAPPRTPGTCEIIDLCPLYGSGIDTMLACHASDEVRAALTARGIPIPPRQAPASNRDRSLPRPPAQHDPR